MRNKLYTLEELIAKEITKALFRKDVMDKDDMQRVIINELKKFEDELLNRFNNV